MPPGSLPVILLTLTATITFALEKPGPTSGNPAPAPAQAHAAKDAKMAAVSKVGSMLEDLRDKVIAEGTKEAKTYNEFACFCATTEKTKRDTVNKGMDDKTGLSADLEEFSKERSALDKMIQELNEGMAVLSKEMKDAEANRGTMKQVYDANAEDMDQAIYGLENAIEELKASKTPASDTVALLQKKSDSKSIRTALQLADALGLLKRKDKVVRIFLQRGISEEPLSFPDSPATVETQDYKFHSGDIIETLEQLLTNFKKHKADLDADEANNTQAYTVLMQEKTDLTDAKKKELATAQSNKEKKAQEIAKASEELSVVSATLLDDQQYLSDVIAMCRDKKKTWEQRSKVRADELSALTAVLGVINGVVTDHTTAKTMRLVQQGPTNVRYGTFVAKAIATNPETMDALEAMAEEEASEASPLGFLQRRQRSSAVQPHDSTMLFFAQEKAREAVEKVLKGGSVKLKSAILAGLAHRIQAGADPFVKIKYLIQAMIEKLLKEESMETDKKAQCDQATMVAKQKRDKSATNVQELNVELAGLEATGDKQKEQLKDLDAAIKDLVDKKQQAKEQREREQADNANTIAEAKAGLDAVDKAADMLEKFYKAISKASIKLSLAQGPADDAPETTFKIGEAYVGAQAESGGIIGMMEVIKSDFKRTISKTGHAEAEAEQEFHKFMTDSDKSHAEKDEASVQLQRMLSETEASEQRAHESMKENMDVLREVITELIELKEECVTGDHQTYDERVARREDEIADLKTALCILENYEQYGSDDVGAAC